nr:putative reverse transcriptase, RNA-dependent DNA polymerase, Gag-polypeptide of LTR copia-type [Tanacetum cinerariifolium]
MKSTDFVDAEYASETDHLDFFSNQISQKPYHKGRATSVEDGSVPSSNHDDSDTTLYFVDAEYASETDHLDFFSNQISQKPYDKGRATSDSNWVEAMNNEIEGLNKNNTWTVCDLPCDRKRIGCKWIYKIEYKASGEVERYSSRLVAKGFSQRQEFDYDEAFSHVVKMVIMRCLISTVVVNSWPLYQLAVNNSFYMGI